MLCESIGINYEKVANIAHMDNRLGNSHYSVPGPDGDMGFGGHCFPKDINALINVCKENETDFAMLEAAWQTNNKYRTNRDWEQMPGRAIIKEKK